MSENGEKEQLPRSMLLPDRQIFGRSVASMLKTPGNVVTHVGFRRRELYGTDCRPMQGSGVADQARRSTVKRHI
jgi:hypothetical protein